MPSKLLRSPWLLLPLTVGTMLPVTGVVPVLRGIVQQRYDASDLTTSLFMSINMVGALIAAPLLGWLADRTGRARTILVATAALDAIFWWLFTLAVPLWGLMALRLVEGAAHIGALSMLMALMSHASATGGRRARMAAMGGAVIFGVAVGAPLGGLLGEIDLFLPLRLGSGVMAGVALLSLVVAAPPGPTTRRRAEAGRSIIHAPPALRLPYLFGFVDRLTVGVFIIAFAFYADDLGYGSAATGLHIGAFMLTFTLLTYPAGRLANRVGLWRLVLGGSLGYGLAFASVPWASGPILWAVMVACGTLSAIMFGPNLMLVVRGSTPSTRASAMGGFNAAGSLGFLVGPVLAGGGLQLLKESLDPLVAYRAVFAAAGAVEVLCVLAAMVWLRRLGGSGGSGQPSGQMM